MVLFQYQHFTQNLLQKRSWKYENQAFYGNKIKIFNMIDEFGWWFADGQ